MVTSGVKALTGRHRGRCRPLRATVPGFRRTSNQEMNVLNLAETECQK
jgi:hypothetical protein